ncbi:MAG TPA: hypothetical protein VE777_07310 [Gaiellales bacterium]|jgi:hypothetical protein|nr:hypothetical protein [Gaiellales bacterium]
MSGLRLPAAAAVVAAVLLGVFAAAGGLAYTPASPPSPCAPRHWGPVSSLADVENEVALSALAGAACRLHVSREALVLAFVDRARLDAFRTSHGITDARLGDAAKAGLLRAIADAQAAGRLNGIEAYLLRTAAEHVPADRAAELIRRLLQ